jgi:hypothetical protein
VRHTLQLIDPATAQRDATQRFEQRGLTLSPLLDGAVALRGQLDADGAAVLLSALAPMTKPLGPDDRRSGAQRRLDALIELIAKAAAEGHAGITDTAGLPPTMVVRVDVERLAAGAAGEAGCTHNPPLAGGAPTSMMGAARAGAAVAELDWGGPILTHTLHRIGCTAQLIRLLTTGRSRVLDLGTAQRLATPAQRIALAARDKGCIFPGCDRPPAWTDVHHIRPWSQGGPTDLETLVLLCRFHHILLHEGGWTLHTHPDRYEFHDPHGTLRYTTRRDAPSGYPGNTSVRPAAPVGWRSSRCQRAISAWIAGQSRCRRTASPRLSSRAGRSSTGTGGCSPASAQKRAR